MANNLRYLLEHFCLDGQKIDISSQLDEENANNIEKINTQTVPSINARIDDIKNTDIPSINRRIDGIKNTDIPSINQKINTINNTTIPSVQSSVTAVDEKADRINESVAKNTRDIGTLSDNVTMQGNTINSINTEKIPSVENKVKIIADETSSNTSNIESLTTNVNELTTKVNTNTDNINDLTTNVGANTDSINSLTTKVDTNTANISTLNGKVDSNTSAISTINNISIPQLQSEINNIPSLKPWELKKEISTTDREGVIYHIKLYSNSNINYLFINYDFKNVTEIKTGFVYGKGTNLSELPLPLTKDIQFMSPVTCFFDTIGTTTVTRAYNDTFLLGLKLKNKPASTTYVTISGLYYF